MALVPRSPGAQEDVVGKVRKQAKRSDQYQTMAAGYRILRSPLADSYHAAAAHYRASEPPLDPAVDVHAGPDGLGAGDWERPSRRG
jgi:hypothetical protein